MSQYTVISPVGSQTVTVYSRSTTGLRDDFGVPVVTESNTSYSGCSVQPWADYEQTPVGTDQSWSQFKVLGPPSLAAVSAADRITCDGFPPLAVDGPIRPWYDHRGELDHVEFMAKQWSG